MLNNKIKIIIMIILATITIFGIGNKVYAETSVSSIFSGGREFIEQGKSNAGRWNWSSVLSNWNWNGSRRWNVLGI